MLEKLRKWNRKRKKNNGRVVRIGLKRMDALLDKYAGSMSKSRKREIRNSFADNIRAYHDYPSYLLATQDKTDYAHNVVGGGLMMIFSAVGMLPISVAVAAGIGARYAIHYKHFRKSTGGVKGFSKRVVINTNFEKQTVNGTMNHEGAHFISKKVRKNRMPEAREEGVAEFVELLELEAPNRHHFHNPSKKSLKPNAKRAIWSDDLSLADKLRNHPLFFGDTDGWAGQHINYVGIELNKLAGKDVRVDLAKELLWGRNLEMAIRMVGIKKRIDEGKIESLIRKHKPANA